MSSFLTVMFLFITGWIACVKNVFVYVGNLPQSIEYRIQLWVTPSYTQNYGQVVSSLIPTLFCRFTPVNSLSSTQSTAPIITNVSLNSNIITIRGV